MAQSPEPDPTRTLADVPRWAEGIVWYQVFPERFMNANPQNDPYRWDRTVLAWDADFDRASFEEIEMMWNRRAVDPARYRIDPDHWWGAAGEGIFQRRFGGDLQGVVAQLDHLEQLGVQGIYLCPIFDADSLHKYEASDHRHIDPTLGHPGVPGEIDRRLEDPLDETTWSWEPADRYFVDTLLPAVRARGMRIILDGVWNHVGRSHFAFRDVLEHGSRSQYADWFKVEFDEDGSVLRYDAWDRPNGDLPEFRQTPEGDLAPGPKAHVFAVTRRWMDPNGDGDPSDGIDGWRLDVAAEVGRAFWRDWRAHVRSINPEAYLVGEIWADAERWFNGVAFDAQMNYPLTYVLADWLAIGRSHTTTQVAVERIRAVTNHALVHELVQMNLIASHDTERGVSLMQNSTTRAYDNGAEPWRDGEGYQRTRSDVHARERLLAAYAALFALPGAPMIYNGDEWALPGADDPDNRRPIPWGALGTGESGRHQSSFDALARLLALRSDPALAPVLRHGRFEVGVGTLDALRISRLHEGRRVDFEIWRDALPSDALSERADNHADDGWVLFGSGPDRVVARWRVRPAEIAP